jgi:two-component system osmolarity sensor histidine kinase EnvZ
MLKHILPRTLFGRSLVILVTPVIVLQLIATFLFYERHWDTVARRLARNVAGDIAAVVEGLQRLPHKDDRDLLLDLARRHMKLHISILPERTLPPEPEAGPIFMSFKILDWYVSNALGDELSYPFRINTGKIKERIEILVQMDNAVLRVLTREKRVDSQTTYVFILWMFGSSLVLLAIAYMFLRKQMRPIRRLAAAAESFGKGREVPDFRPQGAVEVRQAANAFLDMRDRIVRTINQRTVMLAGVSHDLRTPLTRMKLQLAMLGDSEGVRELKGDVDDMERMVEGYLAFARGQDQEAAVDTDLPELLQEVASDARRHGSNVEMVVADDIVMPLRPNAFKRCITNLVENARMHADKIRISAARLENIVEILVEDNGPGIPSDQREAVFRPFHRLDQSRNLQTGGSGLGLSIALDVVRGHGGDISLTDADDGGLRVVVRLPV